jgi:hypothetical protein
VSIGVETHAPGMLESAATLSRRSQVVAAARRGDLVEAGVCPESASSKPNLLFGIEIIFQETVLDQR